MTTRNWQIVSFMQNLFLEDELKYFFLRFYWDVCLFTFVKPIIMGGGGGVWFSLRHDFNEIPATLNVINTD